MKYLKLFESDSSLIGLKMKKYYQKINWMDRKKDHEDFTNDEYCTICGFFDRNLNVYFVDNNFTIEVDFKNCTIMRIVKCKDEWYYVHFYTGYRIDDHHSFSCDQWEGLITFLQKVSDEFDFTSFKRDVIENIRDKEIKRGNRSVNESEENDEENEYYSVISSDELNRIYDNFDPVEFTNNEFSIISRIVGRRNLTLVPSEKLTIDYEYSHTLRTKSITVKNEYRDERNIVFYIYKFEDDWFTITIKRNTYFSENLPFGRYYKCDQWEGLLELLKELK